MFLTSKRGVALRFALATAALWCGLGPGPSRAAAAGAATEPSPPSIQAVLPTKLFYACKAAIHAQLNAPAEAPVQAPAPALPAAAPPAQNKAPPRQDAVPPCDLDKAYADYKTRPTLVGAGDLVLAVAGATWQEPGNGASLHVWLNGTDVSNNVKLIGAERLDNLVYLTLRLETGTQSRGLWATLIHDAGMTTPVPLSLALNWTATPPPGTSLRLPYVPSIAVTSTERLWAAVLVVAIFGIAAIALAVARGVLRDKPVDAIGKLLDQAAYLRRLWSRRGASMDPCIKTYYPAYKPNLPGTPDYLPCLPDNVDPAALDAADKALDTRVIPADPAPVVIGILQGRRSWSYSLAATQLFAWFLFALLAGIYVWTVYGQLPEIEGSVLALLGISVGTAGLSWVIDTNPLRQSGGPSSGFFSDLITDPDNAARIHRFQCVFVNGALLLVGIANVVFDITYPTFDKSWLIFLTISGVTYTGGKQLKEQ